MCHTKWEKDYSVTKYPHTFSLILVYIHSVWSLFSRVIQGLPQTGGGLIKQGEIRTGRGTFFYTDFCRTPLMDAPLSRFYIFWSRGFLVSLQVFLWHASCELGDPVVVIFYQSYHLDRFSLGFHSFWFKVPLSAMVGTDRELNMNYIYTVGGEFWLKDGWMELRWIEGRNLEVFLCGVNKDAFRLPCHGIGKFISHRKILR